MTHGRVNERQSPWWGPGDQFGPAGLTLRESEVLLLLGKGKPNTEIAQILQVTVRTVEFHVTHLLGKLGISSRVEAALWARDHGLPDHMAENNRPDGSLLDELWPHSGSSPTHDSGP